MKHLLAFIIFNCLPGSFSEERIFENPPGGTVATSYSNYSATAVFPNSGRFNQCFWRISSLYLTDIFLLYGRISIDGGLSCQNFTKVKFIVTCIQERIEKQNHIVTELKLLQPLPAGLMKVEVKCANFIDLIIELSLNTTVKNCSVDTLSSGVTVTPTSQAYLGKAQFACPGRHSLYYKNETALLQSSTYCAADATWFGQDNLQCWSAPSTVSLKSVLSVRAGNRVNLSCLYDDELPPGNYSRYLLGNDVYMILKSDVLTTPTLNARDNGKPIYCQAVTPYTAAVLQSGKSRIHYLDVKYIPYQGNTQLTTLCVWTISKTGSCDIKFYSNPLPTLISLTKNGTTVTNDVQTPLFSSEKEQVFRFVRLNVTSEVTGKYVVALSSPAFPDVLVNITFTISTQDQQQGTFKADLTVLGVTVPSIFGFILLVIVAGFLLKRKFYTTEGQLSLQNEPIHHGDHDYAEVIPVSLQSRTRALKNTSPIHTNQDGSGNINAREDVDGYLEYTREDYSESKSDAAGPESYENTRSGWQTYENTRNGRQTYENF